MMTYQELAEKIDSKTLERDVKYYAKTGERPGGYTDEEWDLIDEFVYSI